jgi:hypothetical protein
VPDITVELPRILIDASKAELYATGSAPRPQVHMFAEDLPHAYVGFVICRRFYRGHDAVTAIGDLGVLPSVMKMTRLMILWENLDISTALEESGPFPWALMLVDARLDEHTLYRHPFQAVPTGQVVDGVPSVQLEWEAPQLSENAQLPTPITRLLQVWRELRTGDFQETARELEQAEYELNWAVPST